MPTFDSGLTDYLTYLSYLCLIIPVSLLRQLHLLPAVARPVSKEGIEEKERPIQSNNSGNKRGVLLRARNGPSPLSIKAIIHR